MSEVEGSSATSKVRDVAEVRKFGNGFVRANVADVRNNEQGIKKEKTILFGPIPNAIKAQCPMSNAQCPGATKLLSW